MWGMDIFMMEVTAAIIRDKDKILICQRAQDDECGMLWEFPGGKLEDGETLVECICREIKEELNLNINVLGVFTTNIYRLNGKEIHFTVFNAEILNGKLKLNVHNDAIWVTKKDLIKYEFMSADIEFVNKMLSADSNNTFI